MERGRLVATIVDSPVATRFAALLLEVVVSLAIMVSALGFLGAQLIGGMQMVRQADLRTQAVAFVDRVVALVEFDPQMQKRLLQEQTTDGDFGRQDLGWFWRIEFEPITEIVGLGLIRISVWHDENASESSSIATARPVAEVALLKAARGELDLVRDFGMDEEEAAEWAASCHGGINPRAVDPQELVQAASENPECIFRLPPSLMPILEQFVGPDVAGRIGGSLSPGAGAGESSGAVTGRGEFSGESAFGEGGERAGLEGSDEKLGEVIGGLGGRGGARPGSREVRNAPGARPPLGGTPGQPGTGPRGASRRPGGGPPQAGGAGQSGYTLQDLMRLREQLQSKGGG